MADKKKEDLIKEINSIRTDKNAIILAHYYQHPDIQDIADFVGDSLALAKKAEESKAALIVFAGVHFMAETAKILNPEKKVLLPDLEAGCSLADSCPAGDFKAFLEEHPGHVVVSYINCSAEVKAMSDIICTSSNAVKVIESIPADKPIIFTPDRNLGNFLINETGRNMVLWDGVCEVHEVFSLEKLKDLIYENRDAEILVHPECDPLARKFADVIGSTGKLLDHVKKSPTQKFIVMTEPGIIHQMEKACPGKRFIPAPPITDTTCACSECQFMKLNTLEKLYLCLKEETPEILLPESIREKAYGPIIKMLSIPA